MKIHWTVGRASMILVAFGALLLSSCSMGSAGITSSASETATATSAAQGAGASNHVITIPNNDIFAPYMTVLNAGDTVTWLNQDSILHTILTAPTAAGGAVNPSNSRSCLDQARLPVSPFVTRASITTTVTRTRSSRSRPGRSSPRHAGISGADGWVPLCTRSGDQRSSQAVGHSVRRRSLHAVADGDQSCGNRHVDQSDPAHVDDAERAGVWTG